MTKRRSRGDGGLHWDDKRQRWIASVTVGYTPAGKRIVKKGSGKTKTEAKEKLKEILRDYEDGLTVKSGITVAHAVNYWLEHGLNGRSKRTVELYRDFARIHIVPALGKRKLSELSVEDVDRWLAHKAKTLSTRTLKLIHGVLNRCVKNAMIRDQVKRNVVDLCEVPEGQTGRTSKAFTLAQAEAVLNAADGAGTRIRAYIVLSLLTGGRTEELRGLHWSFLVAYDEHEGRWVPVHEAGWDHEAFAIYVWRSVRKGGDTKTVKSRRTLKLPGRCVDALRVLWESDKAECEAQGRTWDGQGFVFRTSTGTMLSAGNVRRDFKKVVKAAGLDEKEWTPRELRQSFVSVLSDSGVPIEVISRLVGHTHSLVTETVYRQQIRPVMQEGATAMDVIFQA